jgi:hypothetical protein
MSLYIISQSIEYIIYIQLYNIVIADRFTTLDEKYRLLWCRDSSLVPSLPLIFWTKLDAFGYISILLLRFWSKTMFFAFLLRCKVIAIWKTTTKCELETFSFLAVVVETFLFFFTRSRAPWSITNLLLSRI